MFILSFHLFEFHALNLYNSFLSVTFSWAPGKFGHGSLPIGADAIFLENPQ